MSGGTSANNSWTILTSEETAAESLRPLADGTEHHGESLTSAAGSGADPPAETSPVEVVSEEQTAQLSGDTSTELTADASEASRSCVPGSKALSQSEDLPEGPTPSSPEPDSFSDSYTHISTSPSEPPVSLLSADTLEGGEFGKEEERLTEEGTLHLQNGEELQQEGTAPDPSLRISGLGKLADSSEVGEEKTGEGGEPEARRRRSLLASLEQIGRTEEEEEEVEEDFQLPRPEESSGFSLNKCILGAVILLGLGTIFFSGFFMDLDGDSDYGTRELKDSEPPGKQEWLNPEVPPLPADADNTEMLNKISVLQAQVQAQKEELKVAKGQAAEGAKERLRWEEVEKENSRLKTQMASFPVLQNENERMKRELESVPALQKELETLRSTVTELKVSSAASETSVKPTISPPSGQTEDTRQASAEKQAKKGLDEQKEKRKDGKKDKYDTGEKKDRKEQERSEWREGEKKDRKDVGKTGKHEHGKFDKEKDKEGMQKEKERKKEKAVRGDEGKPWKVREGKKEWIEKSERKEEKEWKKTKHDRVSEGKQWRNKEEKKEWKRGNDRGERAREDWKGDNERKKVKDVLKENGKEKWERKEKKAWKTKTGKDWDEGKAKGERKQWEESENHSKHHGKERKKKDESKQWDGNEWKGKHGKDDKEWKRKGDRPRWEEKEGEWQRGAQKEKKNNERKKDRPQQHKDEFTSSRRHDHNEEHVWGDRKLPHTHHVPSLEQPEYWVQQRAHLQHNPKPPQHCSSLEACARAEGLLPVPLTEFEAVLQNYLSKAEEAGVEASVTEQLQTLTSEFFKEEVFVHDQMSFQDFVEDVSDILEHMVEGSESEEEEDGAIEEEMEEFEREVLKKFSAGEEEDRVKAGEDWRKERGRGRG